VSHATHSYTEALNRLRQYVTARTEKPIAQLDDMIHGVHAGTKWEGELRLSDLRALLMRLAGPSGGDWISVKDRLPTEEGSYFCWFQEDFAVLPFTFKWGWRWAGGEYMHQENRDEVTYWRTLPNRPTATTGGHK
jgi:hypothetical protein